MISVMLAISHVVIIMNTILSTGPHCMVSTCVVQRESVGLHVLNVTSLSPPLATRYIRCVKITIYNISLILIIILTNRLYI